MVSLLLLLAVEIGVPAEQRSAVPTLVLELGDDEQLPLPELGDSSALEQSARDAGYLRFELEGAVAYVSPAASGDAEARLHLAFMRTFDGYGKDGQAVALADMEPEPRDWIASDISYRHVTTPDIPFTPGFKVTFIPQVWVTLSDGTLSGTVQQGAALADAAGAALTEWHAQVGRDPAFERPKRSYPGVLSSGLTSSYSLRVAGTGDSPLATSAAAALFTKLNEHQVQIEHELYTTYRDLVYKVLGEHPSVDMRNQVTTGDALSSVPPALLRTIERSIREPDKTGYVGDSIANPDAFLNTAVVTDVKYVIYYTYRVPMGNGASGRRVLYYPSIRY